MTGFRVWLKHAVVTDDAAGDLIGDLKRDPYLPGRVAVSQR
jgi:hypothetical protein